MIRPERRQSWEEKGMNGDTAAALRQIQLALRHLLGPRLRIGLPEESKQRQSKAATAVNGARPTAVVGSKAKASDS
jgi:hypothetical protein